MSDQSKCGAGSLFLLIGVGVLTAAPVVPPREINTRTPQLHLLDPERIPNVERRSWHPAELVGILGEQRGRHSQYIRSISYSLDGKWIATNARGRIYVWEAPSLRFQAELPIEASFMQFVPEGNRLVTCGKEGVARSWDVSDGKPRSRVLSRAIQGDFSQIALSPDGTKLIVSAYEGFNYYGLGGSPSKGSYCKLGKVKSLLKAVFTSDSCTLATHQAVLDYLQDFAGSPRVIKPEVTLWDVRGPRPKELSTFEGPHSQVKSFAFSSDGKTFISGGLMWDLSGDKPKSRGVLFGEKVDVQACLFVPGGKYAITGGSSSYEIKSFADISFSIRVHDIRSRPPKLLQAVRLPMWYYRELALSPNGEYLAVGDQTHLSVWHIKDGKIEVPPALTNGHTKEITALSFGACGNLLATIGRDGSLRLWDLDGPRPRQRLVHKPDLGSWDTLALSADGTKLAAGSQNSKGFTLWDVSSSGLRVLAEPDEKSSALAFTPDSKTLLASGNLGPVKIIDVARPSKIADELALSRIQEPTTLHALAVSPDGQTLALGGHSYIKLYRRTDAGWRVRTGFRTRGEIRSMSFWRDGGRLFVGGGIGQNPALHLFDVRGENPEQIAEFTGHKDEVHSVTASSNGKLFASSDTGGRVIVWSAVGDRLHDWTFPGPVRSLAFAPDGHHLALGNSDGTVYILRLTVPAPE